MNFWESYISQFLTAMGFSDFRVEVHDEEHGSASVFIYDSFFEKSPDILVSFIENINHWVQLIARKESRKPIFFDINNYRRQRETLLTELARTAARRVTSTGVSVSLPSMNSYERRIVHMELAAHPTVKTESDGEGHSRHITIKPVS